MDEDEDVFCDLICDDCGKCDSEIMSSSSASNIERGVMEGNDFGVGVLSSFQRRLDEEEECGCTSWLEDAAVCCSCSCFVLVFQMIPDGFAFESD